MRLSNHAILVSCLLSVPTATIAQTTWWGMTANGGTADIGTIYSITQANVYTKRHDFTRNEGGDPKSDLIKATDGKYWGVTEFGGVNGAGTIFNYDPATGIYTTVVELDITSQGSRPIGGLIQAANGRLYGMCSEGGANNMGTLFEYIIGGNFTRRVDFSGVANGRTPRGRLVQLASGVMVGVTTLGGVNNRGVIFTTTATGTGFTKRYDFLPLGAGNEGAQPFSGLLRPPTGSLLYGVTQIGGANSSGVLYSFHTTTFDVSVLHDFSAADGQIPLAELVRASNGLFYGSTTQGGATNHGTLFSFNPTGPVFDKIVDLSLVGGYSPYGRMIQASNGLLYGFTNRGGTNDDGALYSLNPTTEAFTHLVDLNSIGVADPWAGLLEDPAGTLYGMANDGGAAGSGALLKYIIASNTLTSAIPMALSNGSYPKGRLLKASNGLFYGLTSGGGLNGSGILFSFNPTGSVFTRLVDLGGASGGSPLGTLVEVSGKLYGLCNNGGASNGGTLFEYDLASSVFTKKLDLTNLTGFAPLAGLFKASNGKLYGMCSLGGVNNLGTLFDYVPSTNSLTKRRDLSSADGVQPEADLMQAANGLLYGVCSQGGAVGNGGTLFSFDPSSNAFAKLHDFDAIQGGSSPMGELVQAPDGKLYGICTEGGGNLNGSIYSWDLTGAGFTEEHIMLGDNSEGTLGKGGLILGTDGKLYGTCTTGGTNDFGTLFRHTPTGAVFALLHQFGSVANNGHNPFDGLATDVIPPTPGVQLGLRAKLEGPFNSGTGMMSDVLRLQPTFPLTEPFTGLGFTHVGGGGETINASVLSTGGANAIVDWFFVELRLGPLPGTIVATKSALLQADGDVVAVDGISNLSFTIAAGNYRVVVRHRNHLGAMTLNEFPLSSSLTTIDLTNGTVPTYGTDALKIVGAARLMWAGNTFLDLPTRILKYTGANNDRDKILVRIGGTVPTNTVTGYFIEDCNMDAVVKYTGSFNDRDIILVNIGGTVPTNTRIEQLP